MSKEKSLYFCSECGYETPGWLGKCPACGMWNTLVESTKITGKPTNRKTAGGGIGAGIQNGWLQSQVLADATKTGRTASDTDTILTLAEIEAKKVDRYSSGMAEFDRVLGGGFVPGSIVLVGGDPGIGKSTLLLQICAEVPTNNIILYVCGEESPEQIKLRARRLKVSRKELRLLPETSFDKIAAAIITHKPSLVIIDSIQTIYAEDIASVPGSVSQVRDCTAGFMRLAKMLNITMVLIGHVTKDGNLAGPRILEHMVDTVLYFEQNAQSDLRFIRAVKNRFGATNELGIFSMHSTGLTAIQNPSEMMLAGRPLNTPGTTLTVTSEGTRPLLIELQALIVPCNYSVPQRMTSNLDRNRVSMLLAVADKFLQAKFDTSDVYINIVSGLKVNDTGTDLAVVAALLSSKRNLPLPPDTLICGEIGLTGELRPVNSIAGKIAEADRLGIKQMILPSSNHSTCRQLKEPSRVELIFVDNLRQTADILFK